jgi:hypothetical protein
VREQLFGAAAGSAGQQLVIGKILSRAIADWKLRIADDEGLLAARRDVMLDPFTGPLAYLFPKLQHMLLQQQTAVRDEIKKRVGL